VASVGRALLGELSIGDEVGAALMNDRDPTESTGDFGDKLGIFKLNNKFIVNKYFATKAKQLLLEWKYYFKMSYENLFRNCHNFEKFFGTKA
jgi:hypothetical protein